MMNVAKAMMFLGFLFSLVREGSNVTYDQCPNNKNVVLGGEAAKIIYEGYHYNIHCSWTIPTSVQGDYYAVVLWFENVTLPSTSQGCTGEIKFSETSGYSCNFQPYDCWIYTKQQNGCTLADIQSRLSSTNSTCQDPTLRRNPPQPKKIQYSAGNHAGHYKKFIIHYHPINCAPTTTAAPTTVMSTEVTSYATTDVTTAQTTEQPTSTNSDATHTTGKAVTSSSQSPGSSTTDPQKLPATTIPIIAIVVPIIILLLLAIGVLVFIRRRKPEAANQQSNGAKGPEQAQYGMVKNEIYGENITSSGPETVENQIYDQSTGFDMESEEPALYAQVNKQKTKKESQPESPDIYAVVHK